MFFFLNYSYHVTKEKKLLLRPPLQNINITQFKTKVPEWRYFVVCNGNIVYTLYCDVPGSPCLSKTGPVYGPFFSLAPCLVAARSQGGLLETPPCWHMTRHSAHLGKWAALLGSIHFSVQFSKSEQCLEFGWMGVSRKSDCSDFEQNCWCISNNPDIVQI